MSDVFISYAHADREQVELLVAGLEHAGFSVWWDRQVLSGEEFSREIQQALDAARVAVVVWSKASIESHWVKDEAEHARTMGTLAAVTFDGTLPPLGFRQYQCTDLARLKRGDTAVLTPLMERIALSLGVAPPAMPHNAPTQHINLTWITAAALALVTLCGLVYFWIDRPGPISGDPAATDAGSDVADPSAPAIDSKSVAVLPFVAMSASETDGYFADGLTEEILNALTTVPGLLVTARTSSFYFKGKNLPIPEIAAKLGVAHVVEGSLRPAGDKIRITAQLIRASDGTHLWSQTYDRARDDVLAVQSEIAERVADVLGVFLDDKTRDFMATKGVRSADAFVDYQKGAHLFYEAHAYGPFTQKLFEAQPALERALSADREFSDAWLMHAIIYERLLKLTLHGRPVAPFPERSPEALQQLLIGDLTEALQAARTPHHRALIEFLRSLNSNDWSGLSAKMDAALGREECMADNGWSAMALLFGKGDAAMRFTERRAICNPFDPSVYGVMIALHTKQQNYAAAHADIAKGRELFGPRPPYTIAEFVLALLERDFAEAHRLLPIIGNDKWQQLLLAYQEGSPEAPELHNVIKQEMMAGEFTKRHRTRMLLTLAAWSGDRAEASRLAGELDKDSFGTALLLEAAERCACGSPFPLEATPNFAKQLQLAGLEWTPSSLPWPNKDW